MTSRDNKMQENKNIANKNRSTFRYLSLLAVVMFGFGFALIPMYNVLCAVTGLNGKTGGATAISNDPIDNTRTITVQFLANNNASLPWDFYPLVKQIQIHPGQNTQVAYYARNNSDNTMTVQAIPSVTPGITAKYLKKTECFCFRRQTFKSGEARDMPLLFHIDRQIPANITTVTLSYTMFDTANLRKSSQTPGKITG